MWFHRCSSVTKPQWQHPKRIQVVEPASTQSEEDFYCFLDTAQFCLDVNQLHNVPSMDVNFNSNCEETSWSCLHSMEPEQCLTLTGLNTSCLGNNLTRVFFNGPSLPLSIMVQGRISMHGKTTWKNFILTAARYKN